MSGSGSGSTTFSVAANPGSAGRSGTISIGGKTFTVNQAGTPCVVTIGTNSRSFNASSGTGTVSVAAPSGCTWSATSSATSWLKITSGSSGSGNGTVAYSVSANTSTASRNGTLTIGGNPFTVTQSGTSCTFTISPTSRSISSAGGSGSVTVTSGSGCAWSASSSDSWLKVTSGGTGTGNGTVGYTVSANPGTSTRSATLSIGGKTFTVNQAGGSCTFTVSPASLTLTQAGGTGSFTITTSAGCSWATSSPVGWVAVAGSGSASGTAPYFVAGYTGNGARNTTLTIAGKSIPIVQGPAAPSAPAGLRIVSK
jgi:hypothetical protein